MSKQLEDLIRVAVSHQDGVLSFDQFMNMALYSPNLGYYSRPEMDFAQRGDFTTAPEMSALFGQCLARQCAQALQDVAKGVIFELGAGSGKMAADILNQLLLEDALPQEYWILECSGSLRDLQKETIGREAPALLERVRWLDHLPNMPFSGVVIGNEVMDAMAVNAVCKRNNQWMERAVGADDSGFFWTQHPAKDDVLEAIQTIETEVGELPEGYCTEFNLALNPWLQAVSAQLQQGLVLLIDYGYSRKDYYRPDRSMGTLMCYHQHQGHDDPFKNIGEQDITAHVDFTALAEAALNHGLEVGGFATQMMFLASCGIETFAEHITDPLDRRNQLTPLMHPEQMGEVFKVMGLRKNWDAELLGFQFQDLRVHL